jgi:hypothetical protein
LQYRAAGNASRRVGSIRSAQRHAGAVHAGREPRQRLVNLTKPVPKLVEHAEISLPPGRLRAHIGLVLVGVGHFADAGRLRLGVKALVFELGNQGRQPAALSLQAQRI